MTEGLDGDDAATKDELRAELRRTRSRLRALEAELTETNEGMVALTLELENAKERYQTIFEESTDGILLIDPDRDAVHEANPQLCELLGYERDELVALAPADVFPDERDRSETFAEAVVHGWAEGVVCHTKDGRPVDVDISASMVTLDGRSLLLASVRDVTERKRREQRLQVLTRIFRHNLRNDGNVIQGHADLLAEELDRPDRQARAQQIRETIDGILQLSSKVRRLQDTLDRAQINPSPIGEMLGRQRVWFEETYPEASLSVSTPDTETLVGYRLNVAIQEALDNAAKHAPEGPAVSVSVSVDETRERVSVVVEDDGPGVPAHELQAMRSGGESPLTHGSGIGLWLVYWVVDSLGGALTIRERETTGTRVTMTVPLETEQRTGEPWNENTEPETP